MYESRKITLLLCKCLLLGKQIYVYWEYLFVHRYTTLCTYREMYCFIYTRTAMILYMYHVKHICKAVVGDLLLSDIDGGCGREELEIDPWPVGHALVIHNTGLCTQHHSGTHNMTNIQKLVITAPPSSSYCFPHTC